MPEFTTSAAAKAAPLARAKHGWNFTLRDVLRIQILCQKWGMTPAQASPVAALAYGERE